MANNSVKPSCDQPVSGLDRNQSAEAAPQYEDGRKAKNPAGGVKQNAKPAYHIAAEG